MEYNDLDGWPLQAPGVPCVPDPDDLFDAVNFELDDGINGISTCTPQAGDPCRVFIEHGREGDCVAHQSTLSCAWQAETDFSALSTGESRPSKPYTTINTSASKVDGVWYMIKKDDSEELYSQYLQIKREGGDHKSFIKEHGTLLGKGRGVHLLYEHHRPGRST